MLALVPELNATDYAASLRGWQVVYDRPDEDLAYLRLDCADLMIDGLQLMSGLKRAGIALRLPPDDELYREGDHEVGQCQSILADPDGYLPRFAESLGRRPLTHAL